MKTVNNKSCQIPHLIFVQIYYFRVSGEIMNTKVKL